MAQDLFQTLLFGEEKPAELMADRLDAPSEAPDRSAFEVFGANAQAGMKGISSDLEYFKAAGQTLIGDKKGAAESIRDARSLEALAGIDTDGIETFSDFLEEPTVEGFFTQVLAGTGQILPSAIMSIGSAGVGAITAKVATKQGSKHLTKKLIQEAAQATADGTADATQKRIAQGSYEALRELAQLKNMQKGGIIGAGLAEYAPLTGGNVSEALEAGKELDRGQALRAGTVAIPQAAIGVLGEIGLAKMIGKMASKKATTETSIWNKVAQDFLKGGATEGGAELVQESISVANRVDLEPTYAEADQNLRLSQALFTGFFGGGALAGGGSAVSSTAQSIVKQSSEMTEKIKAYATEKAAADEITEGVEVGQTTQESERDINGQISAMLDSTSSKEAVWISGTEPDERIKGSRPNKVRKMKVSSEGGEETAYGAFIPGRGTIISTDSDVVSEVIKGAASDATLSAALGYSRVKEPGDDLIVRVYNEAGDVVSEQTTNAEGIADAEQAALRLTPKGGRQETLGVEEAMVDRAKRTGPKVSMMQDEDGDVDPDQQLDEQELLEQSQNDSEFDPNTTTIEPTTHRHTFIKDGQEVDSYKPATGENAYEGVGGARASWENVSGQKYDWSQPYFQAMPKSMLETAAKIQESSPNETVMVRQNEDGGYAIEVETSPDSELIRWVPSAKQKQKGAPDEMIPKSVFVQRAVAQASQSKPEFRTFDVTAPGSTKSVAVNPADLMNSGRRIEESLTGQFSGGRDSMRDGLLGMLSELTLLGYDVEVGGVHIDDILNNFATKSKFKEFGGVPPRIANVEVGRDSANQPVKLHQVLKPKASTRFAVDDAKYGVSRVAAPERSQSEVVTYDDTNVTTYSPVLKTSYTENGNELNRRVGSTDDGTVGTGGVDTTVRDRGAILDENAVTLMRRDDAAEARQNQDTGNTNTTEMSADSVRSQGEILTDLNLQDILNRDTTQNVPVGSAPATSLNRAPKRVGRRKIYKPSGISYPFGSMGAEVATLMKRLGHAIKLKSPVSVVSLKGFNDATRLQLDGYIGKRSSDAARTARAILNGGNISARKATETQKARRASTRKPLDLSDKESVGKYFLKLSQAGLLNDKLSAAIDELSDPTKVGDEIVRHAAQSVLTPMTSSPSVAKHLSQLLVDNFAAKRMRGFHIPYEGATLIMVNDLHNTNEVGLALTAAHEMGHALFKEEINSTLTNPAVYKRLVTAFETERNAARESGEPVTQWEEDGFEEWYADKVAAWAKEDMLGDKRGAKSAVDSHFKRVAARFRALWKALTTHSIFRRTKTVPPRFRSYMNGVKVTRHATKETVITPIYNAEGEVVGHGTALRGARFGGQSDQGAPKNIFEEVAARKTKPKAKPAQQETAQQETAQPEMAEGTGPVPTDIPYEQKMFVKGMREEIAKAGGVKGLAEAWFIKQGAWALEMARKHTTAIEALGLLASADNVLRTTVGDEIADLFYVKADSRTNKKPGFQGFIKARTLSRDRLRGELFKILGTNWDNDATKAALAAAASGTPTAQLKNKKAKEIRKFLESVHKDYIAPSNTDIAFRPDYFPVLLSLEAIAGDTKKFEAFILRQDPDADPKKVKKAVARILKYQRAAATDDTSMDLDEVDYMEPGETAEASISLTANIDPTLLEENGFLQGPEVALLSYLEQVTKRVEWNKAIKDENGTNKLEALLADLSPERREIAESVIHTYLGNITPLSPFWRQASSYMQMLNLVTMLPFAVFASIPDFAGSVARTREFNGLVMAMKEGVSMYNDKAAALRFANDIGVVLPEATANAFMSQADSNQLDPKVRAATDKFFKWTGLQGITTLSREFASGMGKRFLIEHANNPNKRSARYLAQLNLTPEDVKAWQDNNFSFTGPEGAAVRQALAIFVEESVLRPNPAERPIWASDPRFALVWQLKSFLYSFNNVIIGGMGREFVKRVNEGEGVIPAMGPLLLITAAAFMPLAALGLELREYAKVGLSYTFTDGDGLKYLRTDKMDYGTYFAELWGRSGLDGPLGMLSMAQRSSDWGGSAIASLLGPTAELAEKVLSDGPADAAYSRINSPPEAVGAVLGVGLMTPWEKIGRVARVAL